MKNSKRLVSMVRKWRKIAASGRRSVLMATASDADSGSIKPVADKGHFVVYAVDRRRFEVPLQHLKSPIFIELLRKSEDAFGITSNGPIILPCDGVFMEHVISFVRGKNVSKEVEKELVSTIANQRCSFESHALQQHIMETGRHVPVHGF